VAAAGLAASAALAQEPPQETARRLNQLFQDYAVASRPLYPLFATLNGWHEYNGQFTNTLSEEHRAAERRYCRSHLERLQQFDRSQLGDAERLSYDVFEYNQRRCLDRLEQELHLLPLDQGGFNLIAIFPVWGSGKGAQPFRTVRDYDNFLQRIGGFEQWMDSAIANMRRGMAQGLVQPRSATQEVLNQLGAMIVEDPKRSPFYEPIASLPPDIAEAERKRLAAAYERAIREQVVPAYRRVHAFVRDEYLPKSRASAGLAGMPGGERLYAYYIRQQLTTDLTPKQMEEIGRREMAKIRAQMEALRREAGFGGDLRAWAAKLSAERPRYRTADEIIAKYRELNDRVQPQLGRLFAQLPRAGYDIRPVEAHREDGAPSQYMRSAPGRPGVFYVNLRGLKNDPDGGGVSELLFLHEALPGHHFQMALAFENTALPGFRRVGAHAVYVEGWASYAETLGFDLGLYRDPYQRLAFHNIDLGRAVRILTDVGLHVHGWTREQAIRFFLDNTLNAELYLDYQRGAESMIDRDTVWPSYGPGYKIGQLKMLELRARAEAKLGTRFDLRDFHGEILKDGSLPLPILEDKIDRWIATRLRSS
jgi:uncharacterized protein (DUF885 family)